MRDDVTPHDEVFGDEFASSIIVASNLSGSRNNEKDVRAWVPNIDV